MAVNPSELCNLFQEQAQWVWRRLGQAKARKFMFSETTITELLLLDLVERAPGIVSVVPFKPAEERQNGADWQWCFADHSLSRFLEARVQAKRLYSTGRYGSLLHRYDGGSPRYQMNRFIRGAKASKLPALYVFYNYLSSSQQRLLSRADKAELWGCSYALAQMVRSRIFPSGRGYSGTSFSDIGQISRPWHELVCLGNVGDTSSSPSLPDRISSLIRGQASAVADADSRFHAHSEKDRTSEFPIMEEADKLSDEAPLRDEAEADFFADGYDPDNPPFEIGPSEKAPDYLDVLDSDTPRDPITGFHILEPQKQKELSEKIGDVRGAVIIREPNGELDEHRRDS